MRGPRNERPLALLGLGLGLLVVCCVGVGVAWFKLDPGRPAAKPSSSARTESPTPRPARREGQGPTVPSVPFLGTLPAAAASWWESQGPRRTVVDQVFLVPDVPSFLDAISTWDELHYFPILIDDPAWTVPFLRAFRPARVVRLESRKKPEGREALWSSAVRAVGRSWSRPGHPDSELADATKVPQGLGRTPPGVVLSDPDSSSLAGGVALAAGRFQPLVRFEPWVSLGMTPDVENRQLTIRRSGFPTVLSLAEARSFARKLEDRVSTVVPDFRRLGDACDFLTLAGDWPYRYLNDRESGSSRGEAAVDDLVGRILEPELANVGKSRDRWAFSGRLLGDSAASVYRAMCALFLRPDSALLWNTYGGEEPWNHYGMNQAAEVLARSITGPLRHRSGGDASLINWHQVVAGSSDRTRLVFFNSSGEPKRFAIEGGSGRPADIPPSGPSAIIIIHSFSAADPTDPRTIAGRWLALGAFTYLGSLNEPYLNAFRPPALVAQLLMAGVPMAAAVRQGPGEPYGQPWRLVYLGDPLYRIDIRNHGGEQGDDDNPRLDPLRWRSPMIEKLDLSTEVVARPKPPLPEPSDDRRVAGDSELLGCLNAVIAGPFGRDGVAHESAGAGIGLDWQAVLGSIPRGRLAPRNRPIWDALVIDAILNSGAEQDPDPWYRLLANIPVAEWSPKVEAVLEYWTTNRLASAVRGQNFPKMFAIWDEAIRRPWPAGSQFPAQLTERVGTTAGAAGRLPAWRDSLRTAEGAIANAPAIRSALSTVVDERKRVETQLSGKR